MHVLCWYSLSLEELTVVALFGALADDKVLGEGALSALVCGEGVDQRRGLQVRVH